MLQMLMLHCEEGNFREVVRILESRKEIDIDNQTVNENGLTLLAQAMKHHHLEICDYLIAKGASVNALNKVSFLLLMSIW